MGPKNLTILISVLILAGACTKRDEAPRKTELKPPAPPTGTPNGTPNGNSSPDLVSKDEKRREEKRLNLVTTNPDISRTPLIRKPRLDDIVAVNLSAQAQKESLQSLKLSVVLREKNQIISVKFVLAKKMTALGTYQSLTLVDKAQKLSAEARCLVSCSDVLVRVRRVKGEEIAFVFKDSELTMIPSLDKDPEAKRVQKSSRLLEIGYSVSDSLEALQKSVGMHKTTVDRKLFEQGNNEEIRRASDSLANLLSELLVASNDIYDLSRLSISGGIATPEQLSAGDQKLMKASQSLASLSGLVEVQKEIDSVNQLREKVQLMAQLLSKN
ncbi:MAG: hypothetical protein A4S09_15305 [Proteobacteria bacterium SG_bin7]|nr:MAG: hypothetical protein A4S09_15305 [Proteobacteria bacterium SG_bin7]